MFLLFLVLSCCEITIQAKKYIYIYIFMYVYIHVFSRAHLRAWIGHPKDSKTPSRKAGSKSSAPEAVSSGASDEKLSEYSALSRGPKRPFKHNSPAPFHRLGNQSVGPLSLDGVSINAKQTPTHYDPCSLRAPFLESPIWTVGPLLQLC